MLGGIGKEGGFRGGGSSPYYNLRSSTEKSGDLGFGNTGLLSDSVGGRGLEFRRGRLLVRLLGHA